jgi:hypothetical protein
MLKNQLYKIWCLSLESNTDRREWMLSIKDKIGLDFEFWNATTPNQITDDIKEQYFKYVNFHEWDVIPEAVMATFISHMQILKWSADNQTNVIVIEDDIDIVNPFDWDRLEWDTFDIFKLGTTTGNYCYAYAIGWKSAASFLLHLNSIRITQAYDIEMHCTQYLKLKYPPQTIFEQVYGVFESNLAPNGYKRLKTHNKNKPLI